MKKILVSPLLMYFFRVSADGNMQEKLKLSSKDVQYLLVKGPLLSAAISKKDQKNIDPA